MTDRIDTAAERAKLAALEGHTPGPWETFFGEAYRVRSDGMNIATAHFVTLLDRIPTKQVAANTCLISAAPDLKDTLATALDEIDRLREALTRIADYRAAAHAYDDDTGHLRRCFDVETVMFMEAIARAALSGEGET